jgi:amylovoran biosynthesis glycosyltransferase AmsE
VIINVSVLMVTYDKENATRLFKCLTSIVEQTKQPDEVIVCLDGEVRQELKDVLASFDGPLPLRLIQNQKIGLGRNLNIGLSQCSNDIIIRCDSDDINLNNRFQVQADILSNNNDIVLTSSPAIEVSANGECVKHVPQGIINNRNVYSFFKNPVNHHSCAFRKSIVTQYDYPDGRMEDWRLWMKILSFGYKFENTGEPLTRVSTDGLVGRRQGDDYRLAEINLMLLNIKRHFFLGITLGLLGFCLRYPLRFSFMQFFLKLALKTTRSSLSAK